MSRSIHLVGAGLAGSLLAIFLARRGFSVTVFERRPDLRKNTLSAGRSINLALANRGMYPLEQIGILDEIRPVLLPMAGRMLHALNGETSFLAYGQRPEEVIYSVSRAGLNARLLDLAEREGVHIEFQQNCRDVDFEARELALLDETRDQTRRVAFDQVIGTDGSASKVREAILKATGGEFVDEALGHGYKELCILPDEKGGFRMDPKALHIWPRGEFMLIALPNPDRTFTLTLFLPQTGAVSFETLRTPEAVAAFFAEYFPDAAALMPDHVEQFFANPLGHLGTVRCAPWHYRDQALVLGDAAHAIVPFHGQGMNCAFEDVSALDACIAAGGDQWSQIFQAFFAARKANAEAIADMALENYVEMRATVMDPKFALKKQLAFALEQRFGDRFIPRYSMVMFHRLPYALAQSRGRVQAEILSELVKDCDTLENVSFVHAEQLVREKLSPL